MKRNLSNGQRNADFDKEVLAVIYLPARLRCFITDLPPANENPATSLDQRIADWHHILGRNGDDPVYSSPFNAALLMRLVHRPELVNSRYITQFLLDKAERYVRNAVLEGRYELTDADAAFLERKREWEMRAFPLRS